MRLPDESGCEFMLVSSPACGPATIIPLGSALCWADVVHTHILLLVFLYLLPTLGHLVHHFLKMEKTNVR